MQLCDPFLLEHYTGATSLLHECMSNCFRGGLIVIHLARPNTQAHQGLLTSAFGEQVKQRYLVFARAVDAYSTHLYSEWEQRVGAVATEKLKQPILCALSASTGQSPLESVDSAGMKESVGHTCNPAKSKGPMHQSTTSTDAKGSVGLPPPPYGVNFATELHMIIRESKYLDRMGFQVGRGVWPILCATLRDQLKLFSIVSRFVTTPCVSKKGRFWMNGPRLLTHDQCPKLTCWPRALP